MPPITGVAPAYANFPEISSGATGEAVSNVQTLLNQAGASLEVDGDWGSKTGKAVRDFQRRHGLVADGIVGPKTMTALTEFANTKATGSTAAAPAAHGGRFDLDRELASPDSQLSVAIGNAEGTRNPGGTKKAAFDHHVDPGNGKNNYGTFSKQNGPASPKEADQAQLRNFRNFRPQYEKACQKAGLDPADPLLAASTFDLYNQSEAAVTDKGGFLDQLPALAKQGVTPENIVKARVQSYFNPDTGSYQVAKILQPPGALKADQLRRTNALREVLDRPAAAGAGPAAKTKGNRPVLISKGASETELQEPAQSKADGARSSSTKDAAGVPAGRKIALNSTGPEVLQLKQALKDAGFYHGRVNDTMGHQGIEALKKAKEAIGIGGPKDIASPETIQKIVDYSKSTNLHVEVDFVSQFDPRVPPDPDKPNQDPSLRCDNACQYMMENNKSGTKVTPGDSQQWERAFKAGGAADPQTRYIESQLRAGRPVMIGVNHPHGTQGTGNTNGANHYLVATGMHSDQKGRYITFNNPAHYVADSARGKDTNPDNRLYLRNGQFEQIGVDDPYQLRCVVENQPPKKGKV